jgi:hypothetical protein
VSAWKAILAALVIFCAGLVSGALLTRAVGWKKSQADPRFLGPALGPAWARTEFLRRAQTQLNLTDTQRDRIDQIIAEGQARLRSLWEPVAPEAQAELGKVYERILAELDSQQRTRFEELSRQRGPGQRHWEAPGGSRDPSKRKDRPELFEKR